MTRMKYLVAAATLSLALVGCSGSNEQVPDNPPNEIYATAQQKLQDGNWKQAITQLEALDNRYPFGPYSQQVQLDLIYAYYKNADLPLAQATIDRFMRLNPTHPNIDYVMYMRGLTNMALDDSALQGRGLTEKMLTDANLSSLRLLNEMAQARGQTMAQMALSWLLKDARVTSVLIGASRPEQLEENVRALDNLRFTEDELTRIDQHVADGELNLWQASSDK